jgi:hypothetical protein
MRDCQILMYKVIGTEWPPDIIIDRNSEFSLKAIFSECGIALQVEKVDDNLSGLPGGRSFEIADLYTVLETTRMQNLSDDLSWIATVLIVPEISITLNYRYRHPLGLMFDTNTTGTNKQTRRGCAIAYQRVRTEPKSFLRTLAHELGHIFNLGHPGEDAEPFSRDAINTLMVPTEHLRPPNRIPETIEFRFSSLQREWLKHAPDDYVRPGGLKYGARPENWPTAFTLEPDNKAQSAT